MDVPKFIEGEKMLTKRQNMVETMRGGKPDRFVKGYEALALVFTPVHGSPTPTCQGRPRR